MTELMKVLVSYEGKVIRRAWYKGEWYFSVQDIVQLLSDSENVRQYVKRMRLRDSELNSKWGTICTPLELVSKDGRKRRENCASVEGILRIIQAVSSPNAEPFKQWLARIGRERIEEIRDPELAMKRMRSLYEQKGYNKEWIQKRERSIAVRNDLTSEWEERGIKSSRDFAILTNEIYQGAFEMKAADLKKYKGLKQGNLRDHMGDIELLLTALGEATTTRLTRDRDSQGIIPLKSDAREGGEVAGSARKDIERRIGGSIIKNKNLPKKESL